jgi:glutathione-specific gamma-glutamylcyclotransferase
MDDGALWVFGYGSLMWDPGFVHDRREIARLDGYRRGFCLRSVHHRGTPEAPGLVLALDRQAGAVCDGVAFRISPDHAPAALEELRAREMMTAAYLEIRMEVALAAGGAVTALAYVVDHAHDQYCGGLPLEDQARIIATATGRRGRNADYLIATAAKLAELGLHDPELQWLSDRVRHYLAQDTIS